MSLILDQAIEVRVEGETVVIEPPEIHGVRGFEIRLTPDRARRLGHTLIGASTQAMPGSKIMIYDSPAATAGQPSCARESEKS